MKRIAEPVETIELCSYGCGNVAKYRNGSGNLMCQDRHNKCPENRKKNSEGLKSCGRDYSETYNNLPRETKDRMNWNKGKRFAIFAYDGKGQHKNALLLERGHKCECCGLSEWMDKPITLELEHSDGDRKNNTRENLKLLCPNCHSQTPTWRGRNKNSGKIKVSDEDLLTAINNTQSFREALLSVGLTPKGGNYDRCNKLSGGLVKLENTSDLSSDASA